MARRPLSLRILATGWILAAFAAGTGAALIWADSQNAWQVHLAQAESAGRQLYATLEFGAPPPEGLQITPLPAPAAQAAEAGQFVALPGAPHPTLSSHIPVTGTPPEGVIRPQIVIEALSDRIRYPVARLRNTPGTSQAAMLGQVMRLLASYCGAPMVIARDSRTRWHRIEAPALWSCAAAPPDRRIPALALGFFALAALLASASEVTQRFAAFAARLRARAGRGGPESYPAEGPAELTGMIAAVNLSLDQERRALERRAMVLSGISHDLGSPATRLRLRAALIEDDLLRQRISGDIERMTEMISSVLAYTRSELDVEPPRQISLRALLEALVDDYRDAGQPVDLRAPDPAPIAKAGSVFTSWRGRGQAPVDRRVLMQGRPMALQRAISNLIDNALKYGRRAHVSLHGESAQVVIAIEDEGGAVSAQDIARLTAPFARGPDTARTAGHGLGLSIVTTVCEQHDGALNFLPGAQGLRVELVLPRG